jgi:hypothetical protein
VPPNSLVSGMMLSALPAAMRGHGDDDAVHRRGVARDDVLQGGDRLGRDGDRVDRLVRKSCMAAAPLDPHRERVRCGRADAVGYCNLPDLQCRSQVAADNGIDTLKRTCGDKFGSASRRHLLGVLKEKANLAA